jgi:hypothetical protein
MGPMSAGLGEPHQVATEGAIRAAALTGVLGGTRRCSPRIEVIGSAVVPRSKVQYLLLRSCRATLACNITEFLRQLAVMLAIYRRDGAFRFSHS